MSSRKSSRAPWSPKERVLILRTCREDLTAHGGFQWPASGYVEAPDWIANDKCGYGLHGFRWGAGDAELARWDVGAKWLVCEVELSEIIALGGKVKFPRCNVVFCGDRKGATDYIIAGGAKAENVLGAFVTVGDSESATAGYAGTATAGYAGTATAGNRGTATAGEGGTATAGEGGTATAGYAGTATAGYAGTATAGNRGTATAGYAGTATAGYAGTATAGEGGTATAGEGGTLQIRHWDGQRYRIKTAYVGEAGIKADTKYRLNSAGQFVEVL